jgi:hypothetical protein
MTVKVFRDFVQMYSAITDTDIEEDEFLYQAAKIDDEIYRTHKVEHEEIDKFYAKNEAELSEEVSMLKLKTNIIFTSSETREDSF